jgi:probable rRNA maturation factor
MIEIEITDQQHTLDFDRSRLLHVARAILEDHGPASSLVSIAVVDDSTIHALNRQYLQHDYPTDVLSFTLESLADRLEGEIVVSADTAFSRSVEYAWRAEDELLLYVVHGVLHLVGFDDQDAVARERMRCAEGRYLEQLGLEIHR